MDIKANKYFYRFLPEELKIPEGIYWERYTDEQLLIMQNEIEKCKNGVEIDGVFYPPALYAYWNHCIIEIEKKDGSGGFDLELPILRDTDWIFHNEYYQAGLEKLGLMIGSVRQVAKSTFLAAITWHQIMFVENPEILSIFSSKTDLQSYTKKLDIMIKLNTHFLRPIRLDKTWNTELVRFGYKEKNNDDSIFAKLYLINTEKGTDTEKVAGKTPSLVIYDEVAKEKMKDVHDALLPAVKSQIYPDKLNSKLVYAFTGGEPSKSKDAEKIFWHPDANHIKSYPYKDKRIAFFLPAEYHGSYKKQITIGSFFAEKGYTLNKDLSNVIMEVTDFEVAKKLLDAQEEVDRGYDTASYFKRKRSYPRVPEDMFIQAENNMFSEFILEFEKVYHYLINNPQGEKVDFIEENGVVRKIPVNKPIITTYPFKPTLPGDSDTAIVLLEEPKFSRNQKFYVMGYDPVNTDATVESASLESWYIMKRETDDYTNAFNDTIVCYYNGRTNLINAHNKIKLALQYFGAEQRAITLLHEASNDFITQWFSERDLADYLEDTYTLSKEITPNTNAKNRKGLRATKAVKDYFLNKIYEYCSEEMQDGKLGLWRIKDPYVVSQIMNFDGSLSDKDAMVGFGYALMHLYKEKKSRVPMYIEEVKERKRVVKSVFGRQYKYY